MCYADPTLTFDNLRKVTESVGKWDDPDAHTTKKWHALGGYYYGLGVPPVVRDEILANPDYQSEDDKKKALLEYYIHNVPMASWNNVAGALYFIEEKVALEAVTEFLTVSPGQSVYRIYNLVPGVSFHSACI